MLHNLWFIQLPEYPIPRPSSPFSKAPNNIWILETWKLLKCLIVGDFVCMGHMAWAPKERLGQSEAGKKRHQQEVEAQRASWLLHFQFCNCCRAPCQVPKPICSFPSDQISKTNNRKLQSSGFSPFSYILGVKQTKFILVVVTNIRYSKGENGHSPATKI